MDVINGVPTRPFDLVDMDMINSIPTRSFDLATLAELSRDELQRHRWNAAGCDDSAGRDEVPGRDDGEPFDSQPANELCSTLPVRQAARNVSRPYCVELLRWALVLHSDAAWSMLQQCFSETLRGWIWRHPGCDVVLLRDSEENYIAQTFSRFWYAVHDQQLEFTTLPAALRYLHATLNGLLMDTLRSHLRGRAREVPLPEPGCPEEPATAGAIDGQSIWDDIQGFLPDERERRVAYLLYYCGLKPRDIIVRCSHDWCLD